MVDVVSVLVSVLVGLIAAFAGVVLGTHYERNRAKAESLYEVKRNQYSDVIASFVKASDLAQHIIAFGVFHSLAERREPLESWPQLSMPIQRESVEWFREFSNEFEASMVADTDKEKTKRMTTITSKIIREAELQLRVEATIIAKKLYTLELITIPKSVWMRIDAVAEALNLIIESFLTIHEKGTLDESLFKDDIQEIVDTYESIVEDMKKSMREDLDRTL